MLLDAFDSVVISDAERASLTWLAGFESQRLTVMRIGAVITRPRGKRPE